MLNEENLAHKKLVVGGLQVIGSMEGGGLEEVKIQVDALQNSVNTQRQKVDDYWSQISGDGVINPTEKKQLKKEWEIIDATHYALMQLAENKGLLDTKDIIACDDNYKALKKYLFETLRLFENMAESTPLADVEVFNSYYSEYYYTLQNAQARVTIGDPGKIRLLPSLMEEGYDGEVALYDNQFYYYDARDREWIGISVASKLGEYQGVLTASPPQIPNQYFLVGPEGINTDFLVFNFDQGRAGEESAWTDEDGNVIYINYGFETGFIYFWSEDNEFVKVEDKDNWRYVIAMSDMLKCGYGISPTLAAWLDIHIQDAVDEKTKELAEDILNREPKYWGQRTTKPADKDVHDKDWLTWAGGNSGIFIKGHVYMATVVDVGEYLDVKWTELSATDKDGLVRDKFMSALSDILEVNPTQTGYFSTVFTNSFFSFQGTMDNLQVLQLELRNGGYIKGGYVANQSGFIIKDNGHAEFNDIAIGGGLRTELDGINSKAGSAASAAATAQSAADTAQRSANTAQSAVNTANNDLTNILNGNVGLDNFHAELIQDSSDDNNWAFRTKGFTKESEYGFGITKKGNVFARNVDVKGTIEAFNGSFTGSLNTGSILSVKAPASYKNFSWAAGTAARTIMEKLRNEFFPLGQDVMVTGSYGSTSAKFFKCTLLKEQEREYYRSSYGILNNRYYITEGYYVIKELILDIALFINGELIIQGESHYYTLTSEVVRTYKGSSSSVMTPPVVPSNIVKTIVSALNVKWATSDSTLRFIGLPVGTSAGMLTGTVYTTSDGTLKIYQ